MTENKKIEVEFAPGCFDGFEGTQEELDQLIAEIKQSFENGEFEESRVELTEEEFDQLPDEVKFQIMRSIDDEPDTDFKRTLQ
jgi:hypothetical protein